MPVGKRLCFSRQAVHPRLPPAYLEPIVPPTLASLGENEIINIGGQLYMLDLGQDIHEKVLQPATNQQLSLVHGPGILVSGFFSGECGRLSSTSHARCTIHSQKYPHFPTVVGRCSIIDDCRCLDKARHIDQLFGVPPHEAVQAANKLFLELQRHELIPQYIGMCMTSQTVIHGEFLRRVIVEV